MTYKEIKVWAADYDSKIELNKFYGSAVHLVHSDGAVLFYTNAFLVRNGAYAIVFTEHHGHHIYHAGDLESFLQYKADGNVEYIK